MAGASIVPTAGGEAALPGGCGGTDALLAGLDAGALATLDVGRIVLQNGDDDPFLFFLILFGGGLFAIYWGWTRYRRYALIRDTPTAKVRSMPVGRVELEGSARPAVESFEAPFTDEPCLYANWEVEEYRYDADDNDHEWVTIASGELRTPFYLEDDTGRVLIQAGDGAEFDLSGDRSETITVGSSESLPPAIEAFIEAERDDTDLTAVLGDTVGGIAEFFTDDGRIGNSSNRRRYIQTILPVDETITVFGGSSTVPVSEIPDREAGANEDLLAVGADGGTDLFLVSDRGEERLKSHYSKMAPLAIVAGLAASAVGLYFILSWYVFV